MRYLRSAIGFAFLALLAGIADPALAANREQSSGPFNVTILEGGEGLAWELSPDATLLAAGGSWSITGWVNPRRDQTDAVPLMSIGAGNSSARVLLLDGGKLSMRIGDGSLASPGKVPAGVWSAVAATYDGSRARLYVNGNEVGSVELNASATGPQIELAPVIRGQKPAHFGGRLAEFKLHAKALGAAEVRGLAKSKPDFDLVVFHEVGGHWPWQVRQWRGLQEPQDPWTLPKGNAPFDKPVAKPLVVKPALNAAGTDVWTLGKWRLAEAPTISATPEEISRASYSDAAYNTHCVSHYWLTIF